MFKKFNPVEDVSGLNLAKSSVIRGVKAKITEQYPVMEGHIADIIPKKEPLHIMKCHEHIEVLVLQNEMLFFRQRDGPYIPTLRLLHKYPNMLPRLQVDKGAIRFILSGANIMCPGLTSPGARMTTPVPENTVVAIMAEGKEHAVSVGTTKLSTEDIARINKGVAVENVHYLCDGLWNMKTASHKR